MKKIVLLLFVCLIFLSSCKSEIIEEGVFVGGTNGIYLSFLAGAPFDQFAQGSDIPVKLIIENKGEYDLAAGLVKVKLYGVDMPTFSLSSGYVVLTSDLIGVKKWFIEEGGSKMMDMGIMNYINPVEGSKDAILYTKVCYPYQTRAIIDTCISSKEIEELGGETVCDIYGEKVTAGSVSSGPVQLVGLTEEFVGHNKLGFKLKLENKGIGQIYSIESICEDLDLSGGILDENLVTVTLPEDITCFFLEGEESNKGIIRLSSGVKTLSCMIDVTSTGSNYPRDIEISLDYRYVQSNSINLEITEA